MLEEFGLSKLLITSGHELLSRARSKTLKEDFHILNCFVNLVLGSWLQGAMTDVLRSGLGFPQSALLTRASLLSASPGESALHKLTVNLSSAWRPGSRHAVGTFFRFYSTVRV